MNERVKRILSQIKDREDREWLENKLVPPHVHLTCKNCSREVDEKDGYGLIHYSANKLATCEYCKFCIKRYRNNVPSKRNLNPYRNMGRRKASMSDPDSKEMCA